MVIDPQTGRAVTRPVAGPDGEPAGEEPVPRPANLPPPCAVCPKHEGTPAGRRVPLAPDADPAAAPWVWQAVGWVRDRAAVNDFGSPDPLLRQVARAVREHDAAQDRRLLAEAVADGVRRALNRRA